ncbi:metallophosphoesterase [Mesorhizobium sp. WSM2561]|uniref:metallophosphoesterase family protein n=1 Tax=Mesorhizobium sp. WSM2561 TaxID=1040985 RepID=UPI000486829C|nr:metallophosphoesterase [Mesorhizobium sp. WSM2561]
MGTWGRGLAAALVLILATSSRGAQAEPIVIGVIGDQTGASDIDASYAVLQRGVETLNNADSLPDVVLHVGDLIESTQTVEEIERRFAQATSILGTLKMPWYLTPGDHDVNPPSFVQNSTDRSREQLFQQLYVKINPGIVGRLYYSFDIKNWHVVALDSLEHLHTDPRWGNVFYARVSDEQYEWLEKDLKANTPGKDGVIVFTHQPLWYNWTGWQRVHSLLARYRVSAVVAGHTHYNQQDSKLDGIQYWVVGSTGGDTKHGSSNAGELHHVTLISVAKDDVTFAMVPLAPFVQTTWTDKEVMDQVQALSIIMGNIYNVDRASAAFLQNGRLTGSCDADSPATIALPEIGNAIARPVSASIAFSSPTIEVVSSLFGDQMCELQPDPFTCLLEPSAGVAVANNSVVEVSKYPPAAALWTAMIGPRSGRSVQVGDPISVELK